jgi:hypothetical protein
MYLSLIKFVLINLIVSLLFIDSQIFGFISKLLYTESGADYLMIGFNMEYNTKSNNLHLIAIRIVLILYLIFSLPINILYVAYTAHRYNTPWYEQLYNISTNPLIAPDLDCSWLNGMNAAFNDRALFTRLQDKLFWNDLFEAHGAETPTIVGTINGGRITKNIYFTDGGSYLIKPIVGGLGNNIMVYDEHSLPTTGEFIIQERVNQTGTKGHFRIVTLSDGTDCRLSSLYMCLNDKDKIASNNHAGGKCHNVDIDTSTVRYMRGLETDQLNKYFSVPLLKQAIAKSINLHKTLPKYIVTVGWDVMLTETKFFFLEGNVPSCTVFGGDPMYYDKAIPINKAIYDVVFSQ